MSKLSSVDVQQLQHCEKCKRSDKLRVIGKLSFCRNCILDRVNLARRTVLKIYGGNVFIGKFEGMVVAVKRIPKHKKYNRIVTSVESKTLRRVDVRPNIVRYYATEQDDDYWYIGMELCAGSLDDVIRGEYEGPPIGSRREVLRQIASGLEYLHSMDIDHGDIDPQNVLISVSSDRESPAVMIKLNLRFPLSINDTDPLLQIISIPQLHLTHGILNVGNTAAFSIDFLKARDIYMAGCTFGNFLSDGVCDEYYDKGRSRDPSTLTVDDLNGDENAFKLIKSMVDRDSSKRPTASEVLESIDSLNDCWNFALGKLTGCDTCEKPSPHFIGKGGFATVFKGKFKNDSWAVPITNVAIKKIERSKLRPAENEAIQMLNEMKHEDLKPKNIVRFYVSVQDATFCYIAMELCNGTLGDLVELDYKGNTIGDKRNILRQIVSGLVHLHNVLQDKVTRDKKTYEVIHRDLKPDNILYTGTPNNPIMKLADFGLCRIVKGDQIQTAQSLTTEGKYSKRVVRAGTDDWMAPEMHNANQFTSASDIFPLGLICGFTLAKGQHPFDEKHPRVMMKEGASPGRIQEKRTYWIKEENEAEMDLKVKQFTRQFSEKRVYNIIEGMLKKKPEERPNVLKILNDPFFQDERIPLDFSAENFKNAKENKRKLLKLCNKDQLGTEEEREFVRLVEDIMDINCTDAGGHTPLMLLCKHRNADSILRGVQTLLTRRKDVNREEINGKSATDILCSRPFGDLPRETERKISVLLNKGIK